MNRGFLYFLICTILVLVVVLTCYLIYRSQTGSECQIQIQEQSESSLAKLVPCETDYNKSIEYEKSSTIEFHYYPEKDTMELLTMDSIREKLKRKEEVKIIIHGFMSGSRSSNSPGQTIKDAYFANNPSNEKYNIILVDWKDLAYPTRWYYLYVPNYCQAARNTLIVGDTVGIFVDQLVKDDIAHFHQIHLIGHSLGAHAAGIAGEYIVKTHNANLQIGRITGLDPAGTSFYDLDAHNDLRLSSDDAMFVDVIHTNANKEVKRRRKKRYLKLGYTYTLGHADFYPNGGQFQPECSKFSSCCSHSQAIIFMAESITNPTKYPARQCDSKGNYLEGTCENNPSHYMGENVSKSATGKFYLNTTATTASS